MGRCRHPRSWTQSLVNLTTIRMTNSARSATTVESTMDTRNAPLKPAADKNDDSGGVEQQLNPHQRYGSDRSTAPTETMMTSASSSCLLTMLLSEDEEDNVAEENEVVREAASETDHLSTDDESLQESLSREVP